MKPFNLEEHLKNPSRKIVTRDGKDVSIVYTDSKKIDYPIIALVDTEKLPLVFTKDGKYIIGEVSDYDLFFAPEKKEGYVNILKVDNCCYLGNSTIFNSKEEAEEAGKNYLNYAIIAKIEWEE